MNRPRFTTSFEEVQAAERSLVEAQRQHRGLTSDPLTGLALSGGGIRSSTFALGVLQALQAHGYFKRLDYLSSVSGGGFIATALGWFLKQTRGRFPFSERPEGQGSEGSGGPEVADFLRWHADYLDQRTPPPRARPGERQEHASTSSFSILSLLAVVGQMMVVTLLVYGGVLVIGFFILHSLDGLLHPMKATIALFLNESPDTPWLHATNFAMVVGVALGLIYLLLALAASVVKFLVPRVRVGRRDPDLFGVGAFLLYLLWGPVVYLLGVVRGRAGRGLDDPEFVRRREYASRLRTERWAGFYLRTSLAAILIGSIPLVSEWVSLWIEHNGLEGGTYGGFALVGALLSFFQNRASRSGGVARRVFSSAWATKATAAVTLYALLLGTHAVALGIMYGGSVGAIWLLLGGVLLVGLLSDLNSLGSHRMYRDRLMETFMPEPEAVSHGHWSPAVSATSAPLAESATESGPFHLFNTSITLTSSSRPKYHGRGADNFVLSSMYCGSESTGWRTTESWPRRHMTVPTAMAVSAAAVNPGAAAGGAGATRGWAVSTILALLNLRLGYWTDNPDPDFGPRFQLQPTLLRFGRWLRPHLALLSPPLGNSPREDETYIELADGGGFDVMGIYELIRRRVDVIIMSDASVDPDGRFEALGDIVQRVEADFGVVTDFDTEDRPLRDVRPRETDAGDELSPRAHALATISYPATAREPAKEGVLVVVRAAMIEGLPLDVVAYKAVNDAFPNEPTFDQFFDERQFEAYRNLGYVVGSRMLTDEKVRERIGDPVPGEVEEEAMRALPKPAED